MQKKPIHDEDEKADSWAEDQKERDYYYDDSHGYEEYDPEKDEGESDTGSGGRGDAGDRRQETGDERQ